VVGIAYVQEGDELLLITQQGMILRMQANNVRAIGRATQGVKLIDIQSEAGENGEAAGPEDKVVSIARLAEREDDDKADEPPPA
jgi:DNA gyrase subunit A